MLTINNLKRISLLQDDNEEYWLRFTTENESEVALNLNVKFNEGITRDIILRWALEQITKESENKDLMKKRIQDHINNMNIFLKEEIAFAHFMRDNDKNLSTELEKAMYQCAGASLSHNIAGM